MKNLEKLVEGVPVLANNTREAWEALNRQTCPTPTPAEPFGVKPPPPIATPALTPMQPKGEVVPWGPPDQPAAAPQAKPRSRYQRMLCRILGQPRPGKRWALRDGFKYAGIALLLYLLAVLMLL